MSRRSIRFIAIDPEGNRTEGANLKAFADEHGLDYNACYQVMVGRRQHIKGWAFERDAAREPPKPEPEPEEPKAVLDVAATQQEKREALRRALTELGNRTRRIARGEEDPPPGGWHPERFLKVYELEAEVHGLDIKHIQDGRSPEEKVADAVDGLLASPPSLFELEDDQIDLLIGRMEEAQAKGLTYFQERCERLRAEGKVPPGPKVMAGSVSAWLTRLRKVKRLRTLAKEDIDPEIDPADAWARRVSEATGLVRYALFVLRSDIDEKGDGGILTIGHHFVKMAVDLWEAENRIQWTEFGPHRAGERIGFMLVNAGEAVAAGAPYDGAMLLYPPRHTKTTCLRAYCGRRIGKNPRTQGAYIHARDKEAESFLKNVAALFDRKTATGRRHLSLYPAILAPTDNNAGAIRVLCEDPPKNPNLIAGAIWGSALGNNLDFLIGDDIVPQEDQTQPTERERRKAKFRGTWLTRLQGTDSFYIISGYPWHHQDIVWESYTLAQRGAATDGRHGLRLRVSKMPVGGPRTSPPFKSIWPEMYPPHALRKRYRAINDPAIWSANYMLNPITDDMRIVKKVRMYDPEEDADAAIAHANFLRTAEMHLSVDPAATARPKSDYAGLVLIAVGDISLDHIDAEGREFSVRETVARILAVEEFHATQIELVDHVAQIASSRKIDRVHVETVSGFKAVPEMLLSIHGIGSVTEHSTQAKNKEQRLKAVASMLEDGSPGLRAKVEFPGTRDGKEIVPTDPGVKKLIDYVVSFRVTSGHHSLDALTQVCKEIAPYVGVGEGAVSREVARKQHGASNSRLRQMLEQMRAKQRQANAPGSEWNVVNGKGV